MLEVVCEKSRRITQISKKVDGLYLYSDYGTLRISPVECNIIRVSYSRKSEFEANEEIGILGQESFINWSYLETKDCIKVITQSVRVEVNRNFGSLSYFDKNGELLLKERDKDSRELEEFDATIIDDIEQAVIEDVETADGKKKKIAQCNLTFLRKLYRTRWHFLWREDEMLFGLGQDTDGVWNLRETTRYLHQANQKIAIPVLMSTKGYGILFATGSSAIFNDTEQGSYFYTEADRYMDSYWIAGEFDQIIHGVRRLTGKAAMLPMWAYGYVQSQERYETQQEILDVAKEYRKRNLGLDAIILDWCSWKENQWGQKTFDEQRFPSPDQMIEELHKQKIHFMMSIWPNMDETCENYREMKEKNLMLPASNIYNAFHPEARQVYWEQVNRGLACNGVDGWWCDSSEPYTPEWNAVMKPEVSRMYTEYYEETSKHIPAWKCNTYGLAHSRTIYEGMRHNFKEKRVVNLTRNTYLGGQSHGVITWSGDISASWNTYRNQIAAGLNYCVTGMPYWTLDIGAFFIKKGVQWYWNGEYEKGLESDAYKELYVRWFQLGAFLPMFRAHGTDIRREVWKFGDEKSIFYQALQENIQLRYRLLPYIYSSAGAVWHDDATLMRMLAFDFVDDTIACQVHDQYMFGKSLLVCPVVRPMYYDTDSKPMDLEDFTITVYLPKETDWYDFWSGKKYHGGQHITVPAPISKIPLFVREGSILLIADTAYVSSEEMKDQEITLYVYGKTAKTIVYEDAGDGYAYESGEYSRVELSWNHKASEPLMVQKLDGNFIGRDYCKCNVVELY